MKSLRNRIKSVNSTLHLTKAMGLVASSKMRKANDAMAKSKSHKKYVKSVLLSLSAENECKKSGFMRSGGDRAKIIVIAGDRGLAGGYNANVFRLVNQFQNADIVPVGKRAFEKFPGEYISSEYFSVEQAQKLSDRLCDDFLQNKYDKLGIVCTKYVSAMTQETSIKWILPIERAEYKKNGCAIFEPDELTVFNAAVKEYVTASITCAVRESFACEVASRRSAMDSAVKNAEQMRDELELKYNRARQGAITREITEIVAGGGA